MTEATSEPEVLTRIEGRVGRITLNRPQALHALTTRMCRDITAALLAWKDDPAVKLVLLDHSGERGFCAGGDIRMLAESGAGDGASAREFFFTEYRLNDLLFRYPKTTVAIMDGVTMGGGVGLSRPCRFRVATERTTFAMPETGIGLFPDVGGGSFLSRIPDRIGLWLALTGARLKAADCLFVGVATDYLPSQALPDLKRGLVRGDRTEALLTRLEEDPGPSDLRVRAPEIRAGFGGASMAEVMRRLEVGTAWIRDQREIVLRASPLSVRVAFRQLQLSAQTKTFAENMAMEYRIAARLVQRQDFLEGVRAVVVEKDNAPNWSPAALERVSEAMIDEVFAPLRAEEEWTPLPELSASPPDGPPSRPAPEPALHGGF